MRYRDEVQPILDRGASVVGNGMRSGIQDISSRSLADGVLAGMADDWVRALRSTRDNLAAVDLAASLGDSADGLYDRAEADLTAPARG